MVKKMKDTDSKKDRKKSPISKNSLTVLERRYLKKDAKGKLMETPEDLFRRVAKNIAQADLNYKESANLKKTENDFYNMMHNLDFMPNSPTLMNAGSKLQQLSACFVLPVGDSMEDIFETVKNTAIIHKSGGGTGFSFSKLRPANSRVASTNGVSSGPISFMHVFDSATEAIKQGGTRRGANMGILRVDHPDIFEFITCKSSEKGFNNFNISIALTEDFMRQVTNDSEYKLIDPHTGVAAKKIKARDVFDLIVKSAWANGEPGIIFIDRINKDNPTPHIGEIESTNPCGEQPLLPYESCNLGSINLANMLLQDKEKDSYKIDWDKLKDTSHRAVHFLDNVIDMNNYPIPEIGTQTKGNRKIGLGVMGFADMLIRLGIAYNSDKGIKTGEKIMEFIDKESKKASVALAEVRGVFPNYKGSTYDKDNAKSKSPYKGMKLRNATTTTIAPTGTISIIADTSSGVEPLFALSYMRNVMDNDKLVEVHNIFEETAKKGGFYSKQLMEDIAMTGNLDDMKSIPEGVRKVFVTSHNVSPKYHMMMQSAFQKYTDNAVSKTINFPNSATEDDIRETFILAAELGCKGVTIYRDGSRQNQVLSTGTTYTKEEVVTTSHIVPRPRPKVTRGTTRVVSTGCGNLYVTINESDDGKPFEIFTQMGKAGGCAASQSEAIARLVSLSLRSGIDPDEIVKQMTGISCHMQTWDNGARILSCSDAISKAVAAFLQRDGSKLTAKAKGKTKAIEKTVSVSKGESTLIVGGSNVCPDCGGQIEHVDGCVVCRICGYSRC